MKEENKLAGIVVDAAFKVHTSLGPGLLESSQQECCITNYSKESCKLEKEKTLPLIYEDVKMELGYRVDILVERKLIVEVKSVDALNDIHLAQILTYLKLSGCRLGLLLNFNVPKIKNGIQRVIL